MNCFAFSFATNFLVFSLKKPMGTIFHTEDEGSRVKGPRISLSDVIGNSLEWKPFNGSWINGKQCDQNVPYVQFLRAKEKERER